jgi:hypothetical protein
MDRFGGSSRNSRRWRLPAKSSEALSSHHAGKRATPETPQAIEDDAEIDCPIRGTKTQPPRRWPGNGLAGINEKWPGDAIKSRPARVSTGRGASGYVDRACKNQLRLAQSLPNKIIGVLRIDGAELRFRTFGTGMASAWHDPQMKTGFGRPERSRAVAAVYCHRSVEAMIGCNMVDSCELVDGS